MTLEESHYKVTKRPNKSFLDGKYLGDEGINIIEEILQILEGGQIALEADMYLLTLEWTILVTACLPTFIKAPRPKNTSIFSKL